MQAEGVLTIPKRFVRSSNTDVVVGFAKTCLKKISTNINKLEVIAISDLFLRVESACIYSDSGQGGKGSSMESVRVQHERRSRTAPPGAR